MTISVCMCRSSGCISRQLSWMTLMSMAAEPAYFGIGSLSLGDTGSHVLLLM